MTHPEFKGTNRTALFQEAFEHEDYKDVLECLRKCGCNVNDAGKASNLLSDIYKALSRKIHGTKNAADYQVSDDWVDIDVFALSLPEARALECVANHLKVPCRIVHEDKAQVGPEPSSD